jgi:hypothetical protein
MINGIFEKPHANLNLTKMEEESKRNEFSPYSKEVLGT